MRVVIGPSDHLNRVVGDRDFGQNAGKDEVGLAIRWLDHVVRGIETGLNYEPPVRLFVMGVNQWRHEAEWPLARTRYTDWYLVPQADGDGGLSTEPPAEASTVTYTYDPDDPTPTLGGNHSSPDIPGILRVGAVDQRPNEDREDVLVYSTPPLDEDVEVTGPVVVRLYAASTALDTDFIARLIDVYPDGTAYNLTEGLVRARFDSESRSGKNLAFSSRGACTSTSLSCSRRATSSWPVTGSACISPAATSHSSIATPTWAAT